MADKAINELTAATTVNDDDLLVLQQNGTAKKLTGSALGDYVYAAAAEKVTEVNDAVAAAQAAVDDLIEDKDAIAATVASMAQLGTDTTLTTSGMAADAKTVGDTLSNLETGLSQVAGITYKAFMGYESNRFEIETVKTWQTESYVYFSEFPVEQGDTITVGAEELVIYGNSIGDIRIYDSTGTKLSDITIPVSAKKDGGFIYNATISTENVSYVSIRIFGVGGYSSSAAPSVGDYSYIGNAYVMIAEAAIPSDIVVYDETTVAEELDNINTELDNFPLKGIINIEDVIAYRERLEYTATSSATWQGGYELSITFLATENDYICVYCDDVNTYGSTPCAVISLDEDGNTIYNDRLTSLSAGATVRKQLKSGAKKCNIRIALFSNQYDVTPVAGDVGYIDHLVIFKNSVSLKSFVSNSIIDSMDQSTIYTLPTEWSSKIQTIQATQGGNFTFGVQTDTHFGDIGTGIYASSYNDLMNNLSKLTQYVGFDFICNLGDIVSGYTSDTTDEMLEAFTELMHRYVTNLRCPLCVIPGNHDTNRMYAEDQADTSLQITKEMMYAKLVPYVKNSTPWAAFNGSSLYYYVDFDEANIRAIFLNIADGDYTGTAMGSVFVISAEQLAWFENTALNTTKQIMVFAHCPLVNGLTTNSVTNHAEVMNAIYNFKTNGGIVIGCFYGHTHRQSSLTDESGVLHITFTYGGTCAEIVMVDTDNKTIKTIGIGSDTSGVAVADRSFSY